MGGLCYSTLAARSYIRSSTEDKRYNGRDELTSIAADSALVDKRSEYRAPIAEEKSKAQVSRTLRKTDYSTQSLSHPARHCVQQGCGRQPRGAEEIRWPIEATRDE